VDSAYTAASPSVLAACGARITAGTRGRGQLQRCQKVPACARDSNLGAVRLPRVGMPLVDVHTCLLTRRAPVALLPRTLHSLLQHAAAPLTAVPVQHAAPPPGPHACQLLRALL
jgi:hypothetical protein